MFSVEGGDLQASAMLSGYFCCQLYCPLNTSLQSCKNHAFLFNLPAYLRKADISLSDFKNSKQLTARETEVVQLCSGLYYKAIAESIYGEHYEIPCEKYHQNLMKKQMELIKLFTDN